VSPNPSYQEAYLSRSGLGPPICPISWQAIHNPDFRAVAEADGRDLTFAELDRLVEQRAALYSTFQPSVVPLRSWNTVQLIADIYGALRAGRPPFVISPRWPDARFDEIVTLATQAPAHAEQPVEAKKEDVLLGFTLVLTSGSTGSPKIAFHTPENHLSSAIAVNSILEPGVGDRWLWSLPAFHIGGLAILWRSFVAGSAVQLATRDQSIAQQLLSAPPTLISLVPTQLHDLVTEGVRCPAAVRDVVVGGASLNADLLASAIELGYPIRTTYGMTETSSMISLSDRWGSASSASGETSERKNVHAGILLGGVETRTDDEGVLEVRGPVVFQGYAGLERDQEDWMSTGDTVRFTSEGNLEIGERADGMILSGGENIDPNEVAATLSSLEGVVAAVVVGVPHARFGERPVAFVQMSGELPTKDWFESELAALLPKFCIPDHFLSLGPIPPEALKHSRAELKENAIRIVATLKDPLP